MRKKQSQLVQPKRTLDCALTEIPPDSKIGDQVAISLTGKLVSINKNVDKATIEIEAIGYKDHTQEIPGIPEHAQSKPPIVRTQISPYGG
jgi:hypothetical protein